MVVGLLEIPSDIPCPDARCWTSVCHAVPHYTAFPSAQMPIIKMTAVTQQICLGVCLKCVEQEGMDFVHLLLPLCHIHTGTCSCAVRTHTTLTFGSSLQLTWTTESAGFKRAAILKYHLSTIWIFSLNSFFFVCFCLIWANLYAYVETDQCQSSINYQAGSRQNRFTSSHA